MPTLIRVHGKTVKVPDGLTRDQQLDLIDRNLPKVAPDLLRDPEVRERWAKRDAARQLDSAGRAQNDRIMFHVGQRLIGLEADLKIAFKRAEQVVSTIGAVLSPSPEPSLEEERQAYEKSLEDDTLNKMLASIPENQGPVMTQEYMRQREEIFQLRGEPAILREMIQGRAAKRQAYIDVAAQASRDIDKVQLNWNQERMKKARTTAERWAEWRRAPVEHTVSVILQSLPSAIAGAGAGTIAAGPGAGTALGAGLFSFAMTFGTELLAHAGESGYDVRDPHQFASFLASDQYDQAITKATAGAAIVGSIDTATAGLAGRFIGRELKTRLARRIVAGAVKEIGVQAAGGGGGEALKQLATGQEFDSFEIGMEILAEIGSGAPEVTLQLYSPGSRIDTTPEARIETETQAAPRVPQPTLGDQLGEVLIDRNAPMTEDPELQAQDAQAIQEAIQKGQIVPSEEAPEIFDRDEFKAGVERGRQEAETNPDNPGFANRKPVSAEELSSAVEDFDRANRLPSTARGQAVFEAQQRHESFKGARTPEDVLGAAGALQGFHDALGQKASIKARFDELAAKLEGLKVADPLSGNLHAFGLAASVWNTAVSAAQVVIRAGGTVAEAIEAAIKHIRENHSGEFDEQGVRGQMAKSLQIPEPVKERDKGQPMVPVAEARPSSPENLFKDRLNVVRIPQTEPEREALAKRIADNPDIQAVLDNALALDNDAERNVALAYVADEAASRLARSGFTDVAAAEVFDRASIRSGEIQSAGGQTLQSAKQANRIMSPWAGLLGFRGLLRRRQEKTIGKTFTPETAETTRKVIEGAVKDAGEKAGPRPTKKPKTEEGKPSRTPEEEEEWALKTANTLITEFSKVQSDTPSLRPGESTTNAIREAVRRQIISPKTDEEFGSILQTLGVHGEPLRILVSVVRKEIDNRRAILRNKQQQAALRKQQRETDPDTVAVRVLREFAKVQSDTPSLRGPAKNDLLSKIREAVKNQLKTPEDDNVFAGRLRSLGVGDHRSNVLSSSVRKEIENREAIKRAKARSPEEIEHIKTVSRLIRTFVGRRLKGRIPDGDLRKLMRSLPRLVRNVLDGKTDYASFLNALAREYGLNETDGAAARKLMELAQKARELPEGSLMRARVMQEQIDLLHDEAARIPWDDMLRDYWYASVLARVGTMMNVAGGSFSTAFARLTTATFGTIVHGDPLTAFKMVAGFITSFIDATRISAYIVKTGDRTVLPDFMRRAERELSGKRGYSETMEALKKSKNPALRMLSQLRHGMRMIVALDYQSSYPTRDIQLVYSAVLQKDRDKLKMALSQWNRAKRRQAMQDARDDMGADAPKALLIKRRNEILQQGFDEQEMENALHVARRVAQNAEVQGMTGAIYKWISKAHWSIRVAATLGFMRAAMNMVNNAADFMPGVGVATLIRGSIRDKANLKKAMGEADTWFADRVGLDLSPEERSHIKMAQGLSLAVTLILAKHFLDRVDEPDEDGWQLTGGMRGLSIAEKRVLDGLGWEPYALNYIKNGRVIRSISYKQVPFAPPFAIVGNMADQKRWRKKLAWQEESWPMRIFMGWLGGVTYIKDISTLTGLTQAVGASAFDRDKPEEQFNTINRILSKTVGRAAAGFSPSFLKEIDTFMENQAYYPSGKEDALGFWYRHLPWVRRHVGEGPALNYIGEPYHYDRAPWRNWVGGNPNKDDPIWTTIGTILSREVVMPQFSGHSKTIFENREPRELTPRERYRYEKYARQAMGEFLRRDSKNIMKATDRDYLTALLTRLGEAAREVATAMIYDELRTGKDASLKRYLGELSTGTNAPSPLQD